MGIVDITEEAIEKAIAEFDMKGINAALGEYGFREAKRYWLIYNGKSYPSKAILGVAHKYARPDLGPLKSRDFIGGRNTVKRKLEQLGFRVDSRE